jgi:hypothetical protein
MKVIQLFRFVKGELKQKPVIKMLVKLTTEFGHMSVQQLHELAQHQQQQINFQYEVLAQKRKQLNYLHYWREYKHRLSFEYGRLLHLKAKVNNRK